MCEIEKNKLVSVLVPSFNEENHIIDCLESIYSQTYEHIEIIIIDDCSADMTYEVAQKWLSEKSKRFVRAIVIKNNINIGISKNFNKLISLSEGDYIKVLAADDMMFPNAIESEVERIKKTNCDLVFSNCLIVDENETFPISTNQNNLYFLNKPVIDEKIMHNLLKKDFIPAPTVMLKKDVFNRYGLYREDLAFEDWEYWLRLASHGCKFEYIDNVLIAYRVWSGSFSNFNKGEKAEERYKNNIETEEKLLNEYKKYDNDFSFDVFWNNVISTCMRNNYNDLLNDILREKSFKLPIKQKLKLIIYRIGVYDLTLNLFQLMRKKGE